MEDKIKDVAAVWLALAYNDLASARLLYGHSRYSNSYFLFQQSAEKANKALGLLTGKITVKELKKFGHDQFKIYKKFLVENRNKAQEVLIMIEQNPRIDSAALKKELDLKLHHKKLVDNVKFIDSLHGSDLINITTSELNYFLRELRKLEKIKIKIPRNSRQKAYLRMQNVMGAIDNPEAKSIKEEFEKLSKNKSEPDEYWKLIVALIPSTIDAMFASFTLYICALLTIKHSSIARYPENGDSPLWLYTPALPIVKKQPYFMDFLEKALLRLQKLNQ